MSTVTRHEERDVFAPLTEDEARSLMGELAMNVRAISIQKEEKSDFLKGVAAEIKALEKRQTELVGIITTKTHKQRRTVRVTFDFASGVKFVWSPFTANTIISTEPIGDEERQAMIPKLGAGEPPEDAVAQSFDEPIVSTIEAVVCTLCKRGIALLDSEPIETRDEKTGELLRTEFACVDYEDCKRAGGSSSERNEEAETIDDADVELAFDEDGAGEP